MKHNSTIDEILCTIMCHVQHFNLLFEHIFHIQLLSINYNLYMLLLLICSQIKCIQSFGFQDYFYDIDMGIIRHRHH